LQSVPTFPDKPNSKVESIQINASVESHIGLIIAAKRK
jgi:hypothetical protein